MFLLEVVSSQLVYRSTLAVLTTIVVMTLASQFGKHLYLELATHFRLQYVLLGITCVIVLSAFQSWKFVPIAIMCVLINVIYVVLYFGPQAKRDEQPSSTQLRLLHVNVLKNNTNYAAVLQLVSTNNPDLVILQEVTDEWAEQTKLLRAAYPFWEIVSLPGGAGMAVFSRHAFADSQVLNLDSSTHVAILARLNINEKPISVLAMHPPTPITPTKFKNRNLQFREAARLLNSIKGAKVLVGDLNTTMWSPYFTTLIRSSDLRDARLGFGLGTSWPMPLPPFLRLPIDHCLVSDDVQVDRLQIGPKIGSDHLPVIVDLSFSNLIS
ncbi:MAG TPA: endonuclease/exonuclease/phosphatase family protein [Pyrinomonadaceae bacterium]|nr:endonuclease/exonuclease/phosphatase family protein [Pyrinomonadaceae bacterium]